MAIDSDIRDQAYQFFIQEASELLQAIEQGLLTLAENHSTANVHSLMRAAHSIKGGAASVGLEAIKTLAHRLEDMFKGLYSEELKIDPELEGLLLQGYDCLRLPLTEQISTGQFDQEQALATAEPVFAQLETALGDFLTDADHLPSSVELGVDLALSIFEVDVAQGLERLAAVVAQPESNQVAGELRAQADTFAGLAELLNLPGFGEVARAALAALETHPDQALKVTELALADFQAGQQAVIAGDRTQGGTPSPALIEFASPSVVAPDIILAEPLSAEVVAQPSLEDMFSSFGDVQVNDILPLEAGPPEQSQALGLDPEVAAPSLNDMFGDLSPVFQDPSSEEVQANATPLKATSPEQLQAPYPVPVDRSGESIHEAIQLIEEEFESLPSLQESPTQQPLATPSVGGLNPKSTFTGSTNAQQSGTSQQQGTVVTTEAAARLSVRVDLDRLERMNNQVGELSINRNSLSLQNEQLQAAVQELLGRFAKFQEMGSRLSDLSDQMLVSPEHRFHNSNLTGVAAEKIPTSDAPALAAMPGQVAFSRADFDSLEMDSYGELHLLLQAMLEQMVQLEEKIDDIAVFSAQSGQTVEQQRQTLTYLRDDLMWARMLPLGELLNRFPRMMRDLSATYRKPVNLKLSGTAVLVDKAALEKLYDPLLHLLRNGFDHGIEPPEIRRQQGKPERGQIEVRAYHQGSQTFIEVRDDGRGLNLDRIRSRAVEMGLLTAEQLTTSSTSRLLEVMFEPGFSTASQVTELSGRGVGLDVVRSQLRSLKGDVTVLSEPGQGTTFTLRVPLTLTITKLLVSLVGSTAFAFPSDSIEEILIPQDDQLKQSGGQRFLYWREQLIPAYPLSKLVNYACPLPETVLSQALAVVPTPEEWAAPMLLLRQGEQFLAIEVERLLTEQELVVKPFGAAIAPPPYIYGCTILGDGSLIPVVNGAALLGQILGQSQSAITPVLGSDLLDAVPTEDGEDARPTISVQTAQPPTLLVVDDSIALRQTMALTLQKAGYRVLQARDGREAIEQLQQNPAVQMVICDIEMPNMNGFEFLSHRRQDSQLAKVPVAMLTSRSSDKHRRLATHLGANAYFTKPYIEQEFLAAIKTIIAQARPTAETALQH